MSDDEEPQPPITGRPFADEVSREHYTHLVARVDRFATGLQSALKRAKQNSSLPVSGAVEAASALDGLRDAIDTIAAVLPELSRLSSELGDRARTEFLRLEADLRDALRDRGWRVGGQWPVLHVERGVTVEIDDKKRTATVAGKKLAHPTTVEILRALDVIVPELCPKKFDAVAFVEALAAAYDAVATREARQAPIFDVYREFVVRAQPAKLWRDAASVAFAPLAIDQFRARLSEALERGVHATQNGRELRLVPPLQPKDGLFLYQPSENRFGFVGRLEFVETPVGEP